MIQEVQSLAKKRFLFLGHDQQDFDGVIAVNGCPRACAVSDLKPGEVPYYSIVDKDNLDSVMEWLFILEQSKKER